jgi:hypothetical protein
MKSFLNGAAPVARPEGAAKYPPRRRPEEVSRARSEGAAGGAAYLA